MSYEMIDSFLRKNLGNDDYVKYSSALESLCMQKHAQKPLTDSRLEEMWEADTTSPDDCKSLYYFKLVARATEAEHKIKGK